MSVNVPKDAVAECDATFIFRLANFAASWKDRQTLDAFVGVTIRPHGGGALLMATDGEVGGCFFDPSASVTAPVVLYMEPSNAAMAAAGDFGDTANKWPQAAAAGCWLDGQDQRPRAFITPDGSAHVIHPNGETAVEKDATIAVDPLDMSDIFGKIGNAPSSGVRVGADYLALFIECCADMELPQIVIHPNGDDGPHMVRTDMPTFWGFIRAPEKPMGAALMPPPADATQKASKPAKSAKKKA